MEPLHAELASLRARDREPTLDPVEREKNVRRKAELKFMIKNKVAPPPPPPAASASSIFQSAVESASTVASSAGSGFPSMPTSLPTSFPTFTPPNEEDMTQFAGVAGFGTTMGFCTGYAIKKLGRAGATTTGLIFMALTAAERGEYITVNWDKVSRDAMKPFDRDGDGQVTQDDAKMAIKELAAYATEKNSAVTSGAFTTGLLLGLRRG